jgi:hypothetical protein
MTKKNTPRTPDEVDDRVSPHGETNPPGASQKHGGQTNKPYDQEPDRKVGNFTGTGEPARKQPGGRNES